MFHFDGAYRRTPIQNLGGSSIDTDRQTLIKNAQSERRKREEIRRKEISSLKIQSFFRWVNRHHENCIIIVCVINCRSYCQRQRVKQHQRLVYDNYLKANGLQNFVDLEFLLKRLLYYYELRDSDKLVSWWLPAVDSSMLTVLRTYF